MNALIIGGGILAAVLLLLSRIIRRISLGALAQQVAQLRRIAGQPLVYRLPADGDPAPIDPPMSEMAKTLQQAGCEIYGDYIELFADGKINGRTRWFRSAEGDIVGWCGVAGTPPTASVVALMSETTAGHFVGTLCGPEIPSVTCPPFFEVQRVPFDVGIVAALANHRAALAAQGTPAVRCESVTEAQSLMNRRVERTRDWRAAQPADQLRASDVRAVLGETHAALAAPLVARLAALDRAH